ncbi:hypothetical protein KC930_01415 [Candidatus Saccharibacteria bacterium]|nr:hypothetical protein [Candidatus Saccharibacteria bacterium]
MRKIIYTSLIVTVIVAIFVFATFKIFKDKGTDKKVLSSSRETIYIGMGSMSGGGCAYSTVDSSGSTAASSNKCITWGMSEVLDKAQLPNDQPSYRYYAKVDAQVTHYEEELTTSTDPPITRTEETIGIDQVYSVEYYLHSSGTL